MTLEGGDGGHRIDAEQELARLSNHRLAFPTEPRGYGEAIELLCKLGRRAEAEAISSAAIMNVSEDPWTWFRHASVARQRGDLPEALDRIRKTTDRFPDFQVAWYITIEILRDLRRYEEAEAALAHYLKSWPDAEAGARVRAELAQARGDLDAALTHFTEYRAAFPARPAAYGPSIDMLRGLGRNGEAETLSLQAIANVTGDPWTWFRHAIVAQDRKDSPEASARAALMRQRFPDFLHGHLLAAEILRDLARYDEAEAILKDVIDRWPDEEPGWRLNAQVARARGDFQTALMRLQQYQRRYPTQPFGYGEAVELLADLDRPAEAEETSSAAVKHVTNDPWTWFRHAMLARNQGDIAGAATRAEELTQRFPDFNLGYFLAADLLTKLGRAEQADRLLAQAIRFWSNVVEQQPNLAHGYAGLSGCLRRKGDLDGAESVLARGLRLFPHDLILAKEYARLAEEKDEWMVATDRWQAIVDIHPRDGEAWQGLGDARLKQTQQQIDSSSALQPPVGEPHSDADADARLYMQFESLGANCEFGLVQRRFGAEPIGLLRWASITVDNLVEGLQTKFAILNTGEGISLREGPNNEWDATTPILLLHLYQKIGSVEPAALLKTVARRIQFMRRKLLEDLEQGEKIFVYKEWQFRMTDKEVLAILTELQKYNPNNRLLAVRLADQHHPAGSVERRGDSLWLGYLEVDPRYALATVTPFASWDSICRQVFKSVEACSPGA
jgi:tetratricopeptide (TPR) repeat protein